MSTPPVNKLCNRLGLTFSDLSLLDAALTHRSAGRQNNERLEYLGDAVLGLVIAQLLYGQHPDAPEGELTRLRANLVNKESLSDVARQLGLNAYVQLGEGERKSGGAERDSILADALEAIIGAIYVDQGYQAAHDWTRNLFDERALKAAQQPHRKDPKTRLQEFLQGKGLDLPDYQVIDTRGAAHAQEFTVSCKVPALSVEAQAEGTSRRRAEQAAAEAVLKSLI